MSDTNWCTFCDCAVNPFSNSIYCSEECFKRDAVNHHPLFMVFVEQQQQIDKQQHIITTAKLSIDPIMMSPPHELQSSSRRGSSSSICSADLAAMHFDMIPSTPPTEKQQPVPTITSTNTPPMLSTSTSPASSHGDLLLGTPVSFSYNLPIYEKLSLLPPSLAKVQLNLPQPRL